MVIVTFSFAMLWLRSEVFYGVLPLSQEQVLTPALARTLVVALRSATGDEVEEQHYEVLYTTWITESWRVVGWSEPTAKLFWEIVSLFHLTPPASVAGDSRAQAAVAAGATVLRELPLSDVAIFLLLHVPTYFATSPRINPAPAAAFNEVWPTENSAVVGGTDRSPRPSHSPRMLSPVGGAAASSSSSSSSRSLDTDFQHDLAMAVSPNGVGWRGCVGGGGDGGDLFSPTRGGHASATQSSSNGGGNGGGSGGGGGSGATAGATTAAVSSARALYLAGAATLEAGRLEKVKRRMLELLRHIACDPRALATMSTTAAAAAAGEGGIEGGGEAADLFTGKPSTAEVSLAANSTKGVEEELRCSKAGTAAVAAVSASPPPSLSPAAPISRHNADDFAVRRSDVDRLGFLLSGGHTLASPEPFLSSLCPPHLFNTSNGGGGGGGGGYKGPPESAASAILVAQWLVDSLTVNETLYPSAPSLPRSPSQPPSLALAALQQQQQQYGCGGNGSGSPTSSPPPSPPHRLPSPSSSPPLLFSAQPLSGGGNTPHAVRQQQPQASPPIAGSSHLPSPAMLAATTPSTPSRSMPPVSNVIHAPRQSCEVTQPLRCARESWRLPRVVSCVVRHTVVVRCEEEEEGGEGEGEQGKEEGGSVKDEGVSHGLVKEKKAERVLQYWAGNAAEAAAAEVDAAVTASADPPHATLSPPLDSSGIGGGGDGGGDVKSCGSDLRDLHVSQCQDSFLYLLESYCFATVSGCTDCTVVVGSVAGLLRVVGCERCTVISACKRLSLHGCVDSLFPVFSASHPLLAGDNRACQFAPYNTAYFGLEKHLAAANLIPLPPATTTADTSSSFSSSPSAPWAAPGSDRGQSPAGSSSSSSSSTTGGGGSSSSVAVLPVNYWNSPLDVNTMVFPVFDPSSSNPSLSSTSPNQREGGRHNKEGGRSSGPVADAMSDATSHDMPAESAPSSSSPPSSPLPSSFSSSSSVILPPHLFTTLVVPTPLPPAHCCKRRALAPRCPLPLPREYALALSARLQAARNAQKAVIFAAAQQQQKLRDAKVAAAGGDGGATGVSAPNTTLSREPGSTGAAAGASGVAAVAPAEATTLVDGAVRAHFAEWLVSSGHIKQVLDLAQLDRARFHVGAAAGASHQQQRKQPGLGGSNGSGDHSMAGIGGARDSGGEERNI